MRRWRWSNLSAIWRTKPASPADDLYQNMTGAYANTDPQPAWPINRSRRTR
jgi:hypothetical protein